MYLKSEIEVHRDRVRKQARTLIRLQHSQFADEELSLLCLEDMEVRDRKPIRTEVRLRHSLVADEHINNSVPALIQEFDQRMMRGELTDLHHTSLELVPVRKLKILDFDTECRPMAYYGGDFCTKEITAIAWQFVGSKKPKHWLLTPSRTWAEHQDKKREGLSKFLDAYRKADIVTGHYIRGFDLPLVNAACIELGLPALPARHAHDTKGDLIRMGGISKSQENLAAHFDELTHGKEKMNTALWERANSLVQEGRQETKRRVVGDVVQHIEFREALLTRGALMPPRQWTAGAEFEAYSA